MSLLATYMDVGLIAGKKILPVAWNVTLVIKPSANH
jgi:hypothetical protein